MTPAIDPYPASQPRRAPAKGRASAKDRRTGVYAPVCLLFSLALVVPIVGCGGAQSTNGETEPDEPYTGSIDADDSVSSDDPDQAASTGEGGAMGCEMEVALECGDGLVDGCLVEHPEDPSRLLTTVHVCVVEGENYGPGCEMEVALECAMNGAKDACLMETPPSDVHVCVME